MELLGLFGLGLVLEDDFPGGQEGEVVFLVARSAEPEMFEDLLFAFSRDDPDDASIAEVVEFSSAVWIETAVDHLACPFNAFRCTRRSEGRLGGAGLQVGGRGGRLPAAPVCRRGVLPQPALSTAGAAVRRGIEAKNCRGFDPRVSFRAGPLLPEFPPLAWV